MPLWDTWAGAELRSAASDPATSVPGKDSPLPHLPLDWVWPFRCVDNWKPLGHTRNLALLELPVAACALLKSVVAQRTRTARRARRATR